MEKLTEGDLLALVGRVGSHYGLLPHQVLRLCQEAQRQCEAMGGNPAEQPLRRKYDGHAWPIVEGFSESAPTPDVPIVPDTGPAAMAAGLLRTLRRARTQGLEVVGVEMCAATHNEVLRLYRAQMTEEDRASGRVRVRTTCDTKAGEFCCCPRATAPAVAVRAEVPVEVAPVQRSILDGVMMLHRGEIEAYGVGLSLQPQSVEGSPVPSCDWAKVLEQARRNPVPMPDGPGKPLSYEQLRRYATYVPTPQPEEPSPQSGVGHVVAELERFARMEEILRQGTQLVADAPSALGQEWLERVRVVLGEGA